MNRTIFYFLITLFLFLFVLPSEVNAQEDISQEEINEDSIREYRTKFIFSFDSRRSFMFGEVTKLSGLKFGFQVRRDHRFGLSFYNLQDSILLLNIDEKRHNAAIDFGYTALFYEYELYNNGKIELGFPIHIGGGSANVQILDTLGQIAFNYLGEPIEVKKTPFFASEISFVAEYKIFQWFGIGTGIGYRKVWSKDMKMQQATSGAIYIIKGKIYLGVIYRGIKNALRKKPKEE